MNYSARIIVALVVCASSIARANQPTEITNHRKVILKCISQILKTKNAVQSIDAYVIDPFRSAIEFTFRNGHGHTIVSDIRVLDNDYSVQFPGHDNDKMTAEGLEFIGSMSADFQSKCHLSQAFDTLGGLSNPHSKWQPINLGKTH